MHPKVEELNQLILDMESGLDFYEKFVGTTNPRHKGIPYMAASDAFSSNSLYAYGKFWRLFKKVTQETGLTSLWDRASGWNGWIYKHRRAMGLLFPRNQMQTKIVDDIPTLVPLKIEKDPERAMKALPFLRGMIDDMRRDLNDLETTLQSDPQFSDASIDDVMESVFSRIRRLR